MQLIIKIFLEDEGIMKIGRECGIELNEEDEELLLFTSFKGFYKCIPKL